MVKGTATAADLARLHRFREENPGTPVVPEASGPVAYAWDGAVRGEDLRDLLGKLGYLDDDPSPGPDG